MRVVAIALVTLMILLAGSASAEVRCDILQVSDGRLYLNAGENADIYPGASFYLIGPDSMVVQTGKIEHSYLDICVTRPLTLQFDSVNIDSLHVRVEQAVPDFTTPLVLGTDIQHDIPLMLPDSPSGLPRIEIREYEHVSLMVQDFRAGEIDGFLSFSQHLDAGPAARRMQHPYSQLVAMVPNLNRNVNLSGALTTSLYYRFSVDRIRMLFNGDQVQTVTSFLWPDSAKARRYEYAPDRGRQLLRMIDNIPDTVWLGSEEPSLAKTTTYFADVLAHDRIRVALCSDRRKADIWLKYVEVDSLVPSRGLYDLYRELRNSGSSSRLSVESATMLDNYFDAAGTTKDRARYFDYLTLAENRLIGDLGVFPLFRPTLFFVTQPNVKGAVWDGSGQLDLAQAVIMGQPEFSGEPEL